MELRHLRYFVVVAEEQNVTRAALRLRVAQPSLSRQIRDLEEELAVALFARTAKSIRLTERGKVFLKEAQEVLLRLEKAIQTTRSSSEAGKGRLKVGYAPSLTQEILPKGLALFEKRYPEMTVSLFDLSTAEAVQRIGERKLDLAILAKPMELERKGVNFEKIFSQPFRIAISKSDPRSRKPTIDLNRLEKERWLVLGEEDYPEYHRMLEETFRAFGIKRKTFEEYDSISGLLSAVEAGRGIALVIEGISRMKVSSVKFLIPHPTLKPLSVGVVSLSDLSIVGQEFVACLKSAEK